MASCMGNCAKTLASEIGGSEAVVVTIKWEDVNQPEVIYDQPFSFSSLEKFVLESSEKILPELTVVNLPYYFKKKSVFMILFHGFDQYSDLAEESLADISHDKTFPEVQFCWLDV
ncbi:uncharacterized protein LOC117105702 [Anneissia japonica]|uniref:uncharacterized protein LOC117105702 n=1 Tax=Anneissia japonica TaxID=1529436 RepID=UPI001425A252|nr:uncharacterized protein LOC117105702 [Anneissia japonica]